MFALKCLNKSKLMLKSSTSSMIQSRLFVQSTKSKFNVSSSTKIFKISNNLLENSKTQIANNVRIQIHQSISFSSKSTNASQTSSSESHAMKLHSIDQSFNTPFHVDKSKWLKVIAETFRSYPAIIALRPRGFGKTLFLNMLENWYDIKRNQDPNYYRNLFGHLEIKKLMPNGPSKHFPILRFEFSAIPAKDPPTFEEAFRQRVVEQLFQFAATYPELEIEINDKMAIRQAMSEVYTQLQTKQKEILVLIDEYDSSVNHMLGNRDFANKWKKDDSIGGTPSPLVRFFAQLKTWCDNKRSFIFVTGVTPIMLDSYISGFNIQHYLHSDLQFDEMYGFSEAEVKSLIDKIEIPLVDSNATDNGEPKQENEKSKLFQEFKRLYNGYYFSEMQQQGLFNPYRIWTKLNAINDPANNGNWKHVLSLRDHNSPADASLNLLKNFPGAKSAIRHLSASSVNVAHIFQIISPEKLTNPSLDSFYRLMFFMGGLTFKQGCADQFVVPNQTTRMEFVEQLTSRFRDSIGEAAFSLLVNTIESLLGTNPDLSKFFTEYKKALPKFFNYHEVVQETKEEFQSNLMSVLWQSSLQFDFRILSEHLLPHHKGQKHFEILLETKDSIIALDLKSIPPPSIGSKLTIKSGSGRMVANDLFSKKKPKELVQTDSLSEEFEQAMKQVAKNEITPSEIPIETIPLSVQKVLDQTKAIFYEKYGDRLVDFAKKKEKKLHVFAVCSVEFRRIFHSEIIV